MLRAYASVVKFTGPFYMVWSELGEMAKVSFFFGRKSRKAAALVDVAMVVLPHVERYIYNILQ